MIAALILFLALQVTSELKQHVDAGLQAKNAGDFDTAIREFRRVAELAPEMAAAHVNLGALYLEKRDYGRAIPAFRRALELNRDLPGAHGMLGTALLAQGYYAESIPHLVQAQADGLLGIALLNVNRLAEAAAKLEAALAKRPDDPDLLYYLAQAHGRLSKYYADRVLETAQGSARSEQLMGEASAAAGNREAAAKHFRAALAARPDLRDAHFALGELALRSGDYESADREFRAEADLAPGSAEVAYKLGSVLLNRGQVTEALRWLSRADTLQPGMPETLLELGKATAASGDAASAAKLFERVVSLEPRSQLAATAHFQLSQLYRKLGRAADADRELRFFQQLRRR